MILCWLDACRPYVSSLAGIFKVLSYESYSHSTSCLFVLILLASVMLG